MGTMKVFPPLCATSPLYLQGRKAGRLVEVGDRTTREGVGGKILWPSHRKSSEDVIVKYGHFGDAVLLYYTPVHPLTIQGHCV